MTAFSPGQSPPPVSIPTRIVPLLAGSHDNCFSRFCLSSRAKRGTPITLQTIRIHTLAVILSEERADSIAPRARQGVNRSVLISGLLAVVASHPHEQRRKHHLV